MNNGDIAHPGKPGVALVFLVAAALLVASVGLTYWVGLRAVESTRKLTALWLVIGHLDQFLSTMKDAETGQRGFLLTGKESYLEPYHTAVTAMGTELEALADLASHGDLPEDAVSRVHGLADQKLAELDRTIKERRDAGLEAVLAIVLSDRGKKYMTEMRDLVGEMRSKKAGEFHDAAAAAEHATTIRTAVFVVTALVNLSFLAWAYGRIAAEIIRREAAIADTGRQKDLLATTLASIGDGVIVTDTEGRITFMNRVAASLTGWPAEQVQGIAISDVFRIINQETRSTVENPVAHVLRSGLVVGLANHTLLIRKDGREINIDDSGAPICGSDGRMRGVVLVFRDITARHRDEEALRRTTEELSRSNQDLEQFAYVASHDLQEPLRMVAGYLQLLSERYQGHLDEKADKFIAYAVDGAERMSGLIRDLLAYSRVNSGGQQFQMTSATEAVKFALNNLTSAIAESGAAIHFDPLPMVRADPTQLRQLFQNLIGNAVKFRSPDRTAEIRVSAQKDANCWRFAVKDNGIGFDEKYRDRMFLIFQRLQSRGKYPGTGIGLAICKRIVERHGGKIWANSEPGQGSTFYFTIPNEGT